MKPIIIVLVSVLTLLAVIGIPAYKEASAAKLSPIGQEAERKTREQFAAEPILWVNEGIAATIQFGTNKTSVEFGLRDDGVVVWRRR